MLEAKDPWEIMTIFKYSAEVTLCFKITHASAFRQQCELQKQFACFWNMSEKWVDMSFVHV